jgi:hypothetical protein
MLELNTNVEKKRFFFKAVQKGSKLWIFITEKVLGPSGVTWGLHTTNLSDHTARTPREQQVAIYSYILGIVPRRLQASRLHRTLKVVAQCT